MHSGVQNMTDVIGGTEDIRQMTSACVPTLSGAPSAAQDMDLRDMVDRDIREHPEAYPRVNGHPDRNIDFRRVPNLLVFFDRQAESLTTDPMTISAWQPGDIVVFGTHHIGIISDKRNKNGIPYLIHNSGQLRREEDALLSCGEISGHFRFNATRLPDDLAIPFDSPVNTSYRV